MKKRNSVTKTGLAFLSLLFGIGVLPPAIACPPLPEKAQAPVFCKPPVSFEGLKSQASGAAQSVSQLQDWKIHPELGQMVVSRIEKDGIEEFGRALNEERGAFHDLSAYISQVADQLPPPPAQTPHSSILQCHYFEDLVRQKLISLLPLKAGESFELQEPETPPGSGARVYLVRARPSGKVLAALKIERTSKNRNALFEVLSTLAGEALLLHSGGKGISAASNLALGKLAGDPAEYFLLQSAAQGKDLDHFMRKNKKGASTRESVLKSSASLFASLHSLGRPRVRQDQGKGDDQGNSASFKATVEYELKVADSLVAKGPHGLDPSKDPIAFAVQQKRLNEGQGDQLRRRIAESIQAYRTMILAESPRGPPKGIHGSYTHGDAHGGNVFISEDNNGLQSELIDYGTLVWSIGRNAGVGDPANDVGRMVGHLEVEALKAGVPAQDASQDALLFLRAYKTTMGIAPGSEEETNFDLAVDFYRTRYFGIQSNDRTGVKFKSGSVTPHDLTRGLFEVWMKRLH